MSNLIRPALVLTVAMTLLTGLVYPLAMTGLTQMVFPAQAAGSLVAQDGKVIGSSLIAQGFKEPGYFHPRPSLAGEGYDGALSGASNLGVTSKALIEAVGARVDAAGVVGTVPVDLVTASGSGLDPHVSPMAALVQVPRIAQARNLPEETVRALVQSHTEERILGFIGEPRVNVLMLNLALDDRKP
ncbi:MAG: potassium-transporting ATPase subunit KdpC [Alphaproteobacteria bacterium]|nr:potassium-transporting ATPase subunit KdpC [Alphaproteobacteria bacterium]MBU0796032.1 potassium-transporting ATPase subunit KdpC [Alphaproteobacteria bacterium]MBU0886833.1 potassium-transporting ATPase subunit KdpC [Alphaproteobacteria bacterium]MBU1812425.1 potassium-transporting ATPase subunit KdpC [Alphaproteobacteria bacterium]